MQVWRICRKRHVPSAFDGVGAEQVGGRWNHKGHRMVYTSSTLSLASLELFVHLEPNSMPGDLVSACATIPDAASVEELTTADLPRGWRSYPAPTKLQDIGTRWLLELRSFALIVPSAVNPEEANILLKPAHPDAVSLVKVQSKPFQFDPRMRR